MKTQISLGICWVTVAALALPAEAQPKTNLQNLPNGQYLLGKGSQPNQIGGEYIVFLKSNHTVLGLSYTRNSDEGYCFKGILKTAEISNATIAVLPEIGSQSVQYSYEQKIDLKGFQVLKGSDSQVNAAGRIGICRQALSAKSGD